jgi:hypothetical protein
MANVFQKNFYTKELLAKARENNTLRQTNAVLQKLLSELQKPQR